MPFSIIVAIAENNAIGKNNQLLWHIPADLKRFKRLTKGHTVIMGKKTWESLPVRPLPERKNVVITDVPGENFPGAVTVYSIREAVKMCSGAEEYFIIGGGSIYHQFMPLAIKLYITHVHKSFDADTFFPEIDPGFWKETSSELVEDDESNDFAYSYVTYERMENQ